MSAIKHWTSEPYFEQKGYGIGRKETYCVRVTVGDIMTIHRFRDEAAAQVLFDRLVAEGYEIR